jgi:hypothetical protein
VQPPNVGAQDVRQQFAQRGGEQVGEHGWPFFFYCYSIGSSRSV